MLGEARIIHDVSEGGPSNPALPNTGMAIDTGAKVGFGIIEVKGQDLVEADEPFDLLDGAIPTGGRTNIVAGSEEMSRVEAYSKSRCSADGFVQGGEMIKGVAKAVPCPAVFSRAMRTVDLRVARKTSSRVLAA
jgi:hypothetical protein